MKGKVKYHPSSANISRGRYTYLLANAARLSSKNCIPAQQACKETIIPALLPGTARVDIPQKDHRSLVYDSECGEVARVLACSFKNKLGFFPYAIAKRSVPRKS
jgi:hypothetical protein